MTNNATSNTGEFLVECGGVTFGLTRVEPFTLRRGERRRIEVVRWYDLCGLLEIFGGVRKHDAVRLHGKSAVAGGHWNEVHITKKQANRQIVTLLADEMEITREEATQRLQLLNIQPQYKFNQFGGNPRDLFCLQLGFKKNAIVCMDLTLFRPDSELVEALIARELSTHAVLEFVYRDEWPELKPGEVAVAHLRSDDGELLDLRGYSKWERSGVPAHLAFSSLEEARRYVKQIMFAKKGIDCVIYDHQQKEIERTRAEFQSTSEIYYPGTFQQIHLGDRVQIRRRFKKNIEGVVWYLPGVSPHDPKFHAGEKSNWAVRTETGEFLLFNYNRWKTRWPKGVKFLG